MARVMVQDVIKKPLVVTIIDSGEYTEGTIVQFIDGHVT